MGDREWIALLCERLKEQEGPEKARQILSCIQTPALGAEMEKLIEAVELGRYNKLTRKWLGN